MSEEGFTFTPDKNTEPTPEEKKEKAQLLIDMSLDDIVKNQREENRKKRAESGDYRRRNRQSNNRDQTKYVNLNLTDRQIQKYLQFADVDTTGYNIRLRLKLVKNRRH